MAGRQTGRPAGERAMEHGNGRMGKPAQREARGSTQREEVAATENGNGSQ